MNSITGLPLEDSKSKISKSKKVSPYIFYLLLAVVFIDYARPQDFYLTFLSPLKLKSILVLLLGLAALKYSKEYIFKERGFRLIIYFWFLGALSIFWAHNVFVPYQYSMIMLYMVLGFVFPVGLTINSLSRHDTFLKFWIFTHVIIAITVIHRGGYGPGGMFWDENDVCLALSMVFPFAFYSLYYFDHRKQTKMLLKGILGLILLAVFTTASRGSTLALGAAIFCMLLMSKRPIRNIAYLVFAILLVGGTILSILPPEYIEDFSSISTEDRTGDARLYAWSIGWEIFKANPFLGVGAANYPWTNDIYANQSPMWYVGRRNMEGRSSHSLYFSILPELGLIGMTLFMSIVKVCFNRCRNMKNLAKKITNSKIRSKVCLLRKMYIGSLVAFLVGSVFLSVTYYPYFWYLAAMIFASHSVVINYLEKNRNNLELPNNS